MSQDIQHFTIYCDESVSKGKFFSNFFGGLLIPSTHIEVVERRLFSIKAMTKFNEASEIKWTKITELYSDDYIAIVDEFFDLVTEYEIKFRVMFSDNQYHYAGDSTPSKGEEYYKLYYQFLKHIFGLQFISSQADKLLITLMLDDVPDKSDQYAEFKEYICRLNHTDDFSSRGIEFANERIASVNSKNHILLQCVDLVLGSMQFRLNDLHKAKPAGRRTRAKRTIAKERVYKHINARIRALYPNFNIGISTGLRNNLSNRYHDPYRHWCFRPTDHVFVSRGRKQDYP